MHRTTAAALAARFNVLSVVLQEVARVLPPAQATQVAGAVRPRVAARPEGPLSPVLFKPVPYEKQAGR